VHWSGGEQNRGRWKQHSFQEKKHEGQKSLGGEGRWWDINGPDSQVGNSERKRNLGGQSRHLHPLHMNEQTRK